MRVALVNHRDWLEGGMDKVALVHLAALQQRGHQAILFAQHHPNNQQSPYRQYFPRNADRMSYRPSLKRLHKLPSDISRTFYNREAGKQFGSFLDAFKPDVVHVHGLLRSFSPSFYDEARQRRIPIIQTHHYVKLICPTGRLLRGEKEYCTDMPCIGGNTLSCVTHRCQQASLLRSAISALELGINKHQYLEKPDLHLAPSHYLRDLLFKTGVDSEKLKVHANFVDTQSFFPPSTGIQPGQYFLYAGRLASEKGIDTMLDAFAPLAHCPLYIAGTGPMAQHCQQRIETENLSHIHMLGQLTEVELVPYLQQAKASLIPSLWGEIFGLTIIESFACGTPVIGSRVGAIPELVETGVNGLLVQPGNVEALRETVLKLDSISSDERIQMGQAGVDRVQRDYTLVSHLDQLMGFYEEELCAV